MDQVIDIVVMVIMGAAAAGIAASRVPAADMGAGQNRIVGAIGGVGFTLLLLALVPDFRPPPYVSGEPVAVLPTVVRLVASFIGGAASVIIVGTFRRRRGTS